MTSARSPLRRVIVLIALVAVVAGGCGTRSERAAGPPSVAAAPAGGAGAAPEEAGTVGAVDAAAPAGGAPSGRISEGPVGGKTQVTTVRPGAVGPSQSPTATRGGATGQGATSSVATGSGGTPGIGAPTPGSGIAPAQPGPTNGGPKSPLVLASVGTYSGPVGVVLSAILYGAQTWVRHINTQGGLNGHPVQLIVFDDGGDPARHRAQVQTAVEQKKALALFANAEVFTGEGSISYVNEKRIPIIGGDTGEAWAYSSPMYFMQGPSGDYLVYTMLTTASKVQVPLGKTKLGLLACAEVGSCRRADEIRAAHAERLGFQSVYSGKASIAQPDFTAECLAARNAGTETFIVVMDANSLGRVAAACSRQGFRPTYVNVAGNLLRSLADNPNFEGLLGNSNVAPFFQANTPGTEEFQRAVKSYGQKAEMGVGLMTGWVAGKLLERAGAQLPEPPTTAALLQGLWSIKNDNLGGMSSQPLTFAEGQLPIGMACWYGVQVKKGVWTSPDGFTANCDSTRIH